MLPNLWFTPAAAVGVPRLMWITRTQPSCKNGQVTEATSAAAKKDRPAKPPMKPDNLVDAEIDELPAAEPTLVGSRRGLVYLGLCLVLIGLNLRTVFSS